MNHLGNSVPSQSGPMPAHMMPHGPRGTPLLTSMPPVPAGSTISPLQIRMAPNTQIQQAMAVAAAMAQNRTLMQQQQQMQGMNFGIRESLYHAVAEDRSQTPNSLAAESPLPRHASPKVEVKPRNHNRRNSESSYGSSGFASPGSPVSLSPSTTPRKTAPGTETSKRTVQGSFVFVPQSSTSASHSPRPTSMDSEHSRDKLVVDRSVSRSPASSISSPAPCTSRDGDSVAARPRNAPSPTSSIGSVDSEPVWRPWWKSHTV